MTLEPTLISGMFEDVIVQKSPAWPVYCEGGHSFVTWSSPLRGELPAALATANAPAATTDRSSPRIALTLRLLRCGCVVVMLSSLGCLASFRWSPSREPMARVA